MEKDGKILSSFHLILSKLMNFLGGQKLLETFPKNHPFSRALSSQYTHHHHILCYSAMDTWLVQIVWYCVYRVKTSQWYVTIWQLCRILRTKTFMWHCETSAQLRQNASCIIIWIDSHMIHYTARAPRFAYVIQALIQTGGPGVRIMYVLHTTGMSDSHPVPWCLVHCN